MKIRTSTFLKSVSIVALGITCSHVSAQDDEAEDELDDFEEIVITSSYLRSLEDARIYKRNQETVVEAFSAQDIGVLPDISIAETLQRLPGLVGERARGQVEGVSIRGMGADLNHMTLNGREMVTADDSRQIAFGQYPYELINRGQVHKTPTASLIEGGISGSINLETISPLEYDERKIAMSGSTSYYQYLEGLEDVGTPLGFRGSVSYIDQFADGKLGIAIGYAFTNQKTGGQLTYGWDGAPSTDVDGNGTADRRPWGLEVHARGGEDNRHGLMGVLQYRPNDSFELKYDVFYSNTDLAEDERGFQVHGTNGAVVADGATVIENSVVAGTLQWIDPRVISALYESHDELFAQGLNLAGEKGAWSYDVDFGYSSAKRDARYRAISTRNDSYPHVTFDLLADGPIDVDVQADLTDPVTNYPAQMNVRDTDVDDELLSASFGISRDLDKGVLKSIDFGVRYSDRSKESRPQRWDQWSSMWGTGVDQSLVRPFSVTGDHYIGGGDLQKFLVFDDEGVIDQFFGGINAPDMGASDLVRGWLIEEKVFAQYAQLNFAGDLGGLPFTANAGVRFVQTDTNAHGYEAEVVNDIPLGEPMEFSIENNYNDVLPSFNITFELSENQLLRLGASKAIARAPMSFLNPSISSQEWNGSWGSWKQSDAGNPELQPYRADQLDLSWENYFADNSLFAIALFYKDLKSYIGMSQETIVNGNATHVISQPVNGEGGNIKGIEVIYQQPLTFLPAPLDGFSVNANFAYVDSNAVQMIDLENPLRIQGQSKYSTSLSLAYTRDRFDIRADYSYRSSYARRLTEVNRGEGWVDMNASYQVNDQLKLSFQVANLTNSRYKTYWENNPLHTGRWEDFGRRFFFRVNYNM